MELYRWAHQLLAALKLCFDTTSYPSVKTESRSSIQNSPNDEIENN